MADTRPARTAICENGPVSAGREVPAFGIEPRQPQDLPRCAGLLHSVHVADGYPTFWPSDPARWLVAKRGLAAWVARDEGSRVQGHVALQGVGDGRSAELWCEAAGVGPERLSVVEKLFVSPTHRRQHLGEALIGVATSYAHEHGTRPVLDVAQRGLAAIRLYERLGWRRVGAWELPVDQERRLPVFCYLGPPPRDQP